MIRVVLFCFLILAVARPLLTQAARPNVLLIYTDDQGSLDLNCYGSDDLETPNLDNLASTGVRFTQMYAPSAICSASARWLIDGPLSRPRWCTWQRIVDGRKLGNAVG